MSSHTFSLVFLSYRNLSLFFSFIATFFHPLHHLFFFWHSFESFSQTGLSFMIVSAPTHVLYFTHHLHSCWSTMAQNLWPRTTCFWQTLKTSSLPAFQIAHTRIPSFFFSALEVDITESLSLSLPSILFSLRFADVWIKNQHSNGLRSFYFLHASVSSMTTRVLGNPSNRPAKFSVFMG